MTAGTTTKTWNWNASSIPTVAKRAMVNSHNFPFDRPVAQPFLSLVVPQCARGSRPTVTQNNLLRRNKSLKFNKTRLWTADAMRHAKTLG
jgi:hypothetical protein